MAERSKKEKACKALDEWLEEMISDLPFFSRESLPTMAEAMLKVSELKEKLGCYMMEEK